MLLHPSKHYIYYLFSKRTLSTADLIKHLGDLHLPVPQDDGPSLKHYVRTVVEERGRMKFPAGFDPTSRNLSPGDEQFLAHWKIKAMWRGDDFVKRAMDLLFEPHIRRVLQTLILGPLNMGDIAKIVQHRFGMNTTAMNTGVVNAYAHYFWDYNSMNAVEWRSFLHTYCPGNNDDYLTALLAPRDQSGARLTIAVADRGGETIDAITQFTTMRNYGFRMFMQHALTDKPSLYRTQAAQIALSIVTSCEEELDKRRGGNADIVDELQKIKARHDNTILATAKELPIVPRMLPAESPEDALEADLKKEGAV